MESWQILLILIAVYGFIYLIVKIIDLTNILRESKRQKRLDGIASAMLMDFDFNKEMGEIKSIGDRYESKEIVETESNRDSYVSRSYKCPKCRGTLVVKNGRYGKFWGCNRFPNCKYTRDIRG
jgi:hypothetical protein